MFQALGNKGATTFKARFLSDVCFPYDGVNVRHRGTRQRERERPKHVAKLASRFSVGAVFWTWREWGEDFSFGGCTIQIRFRRGFQALIATRDLPHVPIPPRRRGHMSSRGWRAKITLRTVCERPCGEDDGEWRGRHPRSPPAVFPPRASQIGIESRL